MLPDPDRILRRIHDLGADEWSDVEVVAHVADRVRIPRRDPADSFVLHAPLELLARAALLPRVAPAGRTAARRRMFSLLDQYEQWEPADLPADPLRPTDPAAAAADLVRALGAGDLDAADAAARGVAGVPDPVDVTRLVGAALLPNLAAAAHAPIFLYHLPRVSPRGEVPAELLRPLARELARHPGLAITWVADRPRRGGDPEALAAALRSVPHLGIPGSPFIFPLMHQVDAGGQAADLLAAATAGLTVRAAAPVLMRHAARAMLDADPAHVPYGWSHCLTLPQAALAVGPAAGDEGLAVAVAATHVVGFLAAFATEPVDPRAPLDPGTPPSWTEIVTRASAQHDAHLVKYTLACVDAAAADPGAAGLYRAAAGRLLAFWEAVENPDDPFAELLTVASGEVGATG